jgi:hypothetical protein
MAIMELGENLDALFQCQLLKIAVAMAAWAASWQRNKFGADMLGHLSPKTSLNLC